MNKRRFVECCDKGTCGFETRCGYGFHIDHFDRNEISFRVTKYDVNTTRNEMSTHVHQNIWSF